jgi:transcriptional regulator with XRE-family HTH domain
MLSDHELNAQIGQALKDERERRHYSLDYIADALGVSHVAVFYWETGRNGISAAQLKKYCDVLNITMSDIARMIRW